MHYWQEVLKVMGITGRNPSSRIKDSQIRGRSPSVWPIMHQCSGGFSGGFTNLTGGQVLAGS